MRCLSERWGGWSALDSAPESHLSESQRHWRRGDLSWLDCDRLAAFLTQKKKFVHLLTNMIFFFFYLQPVWVYFSMDGCLIHDNISNNIYVIRWLHLKIICLFLWHLCILNMHLFLTTVCKSVVYKVFSQYKIKGKQQCETLLLSQQSILTIIFHKAGLDYYSWQATILIFRMEHCIYFYPLISNKVSYLHSSQTKVVLHDTLGWELMQHLCD